MTYLILRRILLAIPTLFLVSIIVFGMQKLLPGDPAIAMAGEDRDPAVIEQMREDLGLNKPLPVQYMNWVSAALEGDFGVSLRTQIPVSELIKEKLPVTLQLSLIAILFAMLVGIPAGILAAYRKGSLLELFTNAFVIGGMSVPSFWLGILAILLFSVNLGWLPSSGFVSLHEDWRESLRTSLLPGLVLGTVICAYLARHTRSAMLEQLSADYVRTARARGIGEFKVVMFHAFRNALTPIITVTTILFGELLAGAVLTEQIFSIPGFGKLLVDAVFSRDYAVVQGIVLVVAFAFIALTLLADILYIVSNPRLKTNR